MIGPWRSRARNNRGEGKELSLREGGPQGRSDDTLSSREQFYRGLTGQGGGWEDPGGLSCGVERTELR